MGGRGGENRGRLLGKKVIVRRSLYWPRAGLEQGGSLGIMPLGRLRIPSTKGKGWGEGRGTK